MAEEKKIIVDGAEIIFVEFDSPPGVNSMTDKAKGFILHNETEEEDEDHEFSAVICPVVLFTKEPKQVVIELTSQESHHLFTLSSNQAKELAKWIIENLGV
jgi:hypothetical protein